LVAVSGALDGCEPRREPSAGRSVRFDGTELVPYRTLERDDFRGSMATGFPLSEAEKIRAVTCTRIVAHHDAVTGAADGSVPNFYAVMSRQCSWWNSEEDLPLEQILEHQQIHFAIHELEARRLNGRAGRIASSELPGILEGAQNASLERSTVFDYQVVRDRVRQRQWFHKIGAELEATRAYARGPQTTVSAAPLPPPAPAPPPPAAAPAPVPPPPAPVQPPSTPAPIPKPPAGPAPSTSTGAFPD
jgi:hypothetical protein